MAFSVSALQNSSLKDCYAYRCNFDGTQLRHAVLAEADFNESSLRSADLRFTKAEHVEFSVCEMSDVNAHSADFSNAHFRSTLHRADWTRAKVGGAILDDCDFSGAEFDLLRVGSTFVRIEPPVTAEKIEQAVRRVDFDESDSTSAT